MFAVGGGSKYIRNCTAATLTFTIQLFDEILFVGVEFILHLLGETISEFLKLVYVFLVDFVF